MHKKTRHLVLLFLLLLVGSGVLILSLQQKDAGEEVETPRDLTRQVSAPEPTSRETLLKLQELGARWKRNQHGQVNWLYLKHLPIADDDLVILQDLPEVRLVHMRAIQQAKGNHFTNAGLRHLLCLKKLETLDLSANNRLTSECFETLKQLKGLKSLNLEYTSFTKANLPELCQIKSLEILHVPGFPLNETTIGYFEQMPLRELRGISNYESYSMLQLLPRLTHLEILPYRGSKWIKDTDLVHLSHIRKIKTLSVELTKGFHDTSLLTHLQNIELESLKIGSQIQTGTDPIDSSGFDALAKVSSLQKIKFGAIDDRCLEAISHCTQLTEFDLTGAAKSLTPEGLICLKKMTRLKTISLKKPLIQAKTFEVLRQIPSLEQILMRGWELDWASKDTTPPPVGKPEFDMSSLKHLQHLPRLKELKLNYLDLNDEALKQIGQCKTLERLSLINANITNAGLLHLHSLSQLKNLDLTGTKVDLEAAYSLHKSIPECVIEDIWYAADGMMPVFLTDFEQWNTFRRKLHYELD